VSVTGDQLCTVDDVAARLGTVIEPGTPEYGKTEAACNYTTAVLRARFPLIPATPVPEPVNVVATEVTVRYLGADPAAGGFTSETIGAYSYQRKSGMWSTALTDDEYAVMSMYSGSGGPVTMVQLSNGPAATCPACGGSLLDDECFSHGHAASVPLGMVAR